jgi:hypothetical protein
LARWTAWRLREYSFAPSGQYDLECLAHRRGDADSAILTLLDSAAGWSRAFVVIGAAGLPV